MYIENNIHTIDIHYMSYTLYSITHPKVTVYASVLIVFMARYTNSPETATGAGAWFQA